MEYTFNPEEAYELIKSDITTWAAETGAKKFMVGISGGKDSTVTAMLLTSIFGAENVYGVTMPCGHQCDIGDSNAVINILGIKGLDFNIEKMVDTFIYTVIQNRKESGVYLNYDCETNLPARVRMTVLFGLAQCVNARVINTCNLSEDICGYATLFGDNAGTYAPIQGLTVTEIRQLGKWLIDKLGIKDDTFDLRRIACCCDSPHVKVNNVITKGERLLELIDKTPVDGLQPLTDEDKLGFTYADLDNFIRKNEGSDEFKQTIRDLYKKNKFKTDIVNLHQPKWNYPNFVHENITTTVK